MPDSHMDRAAPSAAALEVQGLIRRSRAAQAEIANATQEQVDAYFGFPPGSYVKTPKGLMLVPKPKAPKTIDPTTGEN